jgi:hypothetical protein
LPSRDFFVESPFLSQKSKVLAEGSTGNYVIINACDYQNFLGNAFDFFAFCSTFAVLLNSG